MMKMIPHAVYPRLQREKGVRVVYTVYGHIITTLSNETSYWVTDPTLFYATRPGYVFTPGTQHQDTLLDLKQEPTTPYIAHFQENGVIVMDENQVAVGGIMLVDEYLVGLSLSPNANQTHFWNAIVATLRKFNYTMLNVGRTKLPADVAQSSLSFNVTYHNEVIKP